MSLCNEPLIYQHSLSLNSLTRRQHSLIKGHLVDMDNRFNEVFSSFDLINPELFPSHRIINTYTNHFSFYPFNKQADHNITSQVQELDRIPIKLSDSPLTALVILDASIKNSVASFITHIHIKNRPITKTLHHTLNVMSTEAKLVTIRCGINQATNYNFISTIIVVMDSIYMTKKIFDPSSHLFQKYAVSILRELCSFFSHYPDNYIEFWECPSHSKWHLHKAINSETKFIRLIPFYPSKLSWDFSRKLECDDLANKWKMMF